MDKELSKDALRPSPSPDKNRSLTPGQIRHFVEEGYLILPNLFNPTEMQEISDSFDALQEISLKLTTPQTINGSYFVVNNGKIDRIVWCGAAAPALLRFGEDRRLTNPASQLLGSTEMDQLICQAHYKIPADEVSFGWHQDSEHRRYGTPEWTDMNGQGSFVQTIMAVDEMREDNGPLLVVPRSHLNGHLSLNKQNISLEAPPWEEVLPVLMPPGSVLLIGPYLVHGSQPNRSKTRRRVFINGYAYPKANSRVYPGEGSGRRITVK